MNIINDNVEEKNKNISIIKSLPTEITFFTIKKVLLLQKLFEIDPNVIFLQNNRFIDQESSNISALNVTQKEDTIKNILNDISFVNETITNHIYLDTIDKTKNLNLLNFEETKITKDNLYAAVKKYLEPLIPNDCPQKDKVSLLFDSFFTNKKLIQDKANISKEFSFYPLPNNLKETEFNGFKSEIVNLKNSYIYDDFFDFMVNLLFTIKNKNLITPDLTTLEFKQENDEYYTILIKNTNNDTVFEQKYTPVEVATPICFSHSYNIEPNNFLLSQKFINHFYNDFFFQENFETFLQDLVSSVEKKCLQVDLDTQYKKTNSKRL